MLTSEIKPQVIEHGRCGKFNLSIYVVDICLSSTLVERHIFFNCRKYHSFVSHLSRNFPLLSPYTSGISYDYYDTYYSPEEYESLINL